MGKQVIGFMFLLMVGLVCAGISLPHAFNGNVEYSNGTNVQGVIVAKINGVEAGSANIVNGVYDLVVESENEGVLISFYFEDELIGTYEFESFTVTELDFVIDVPADDDDDGGSSSSSSSSSSGGSSYTSQIDYDEYPPEERNAVQDFETQTISSGITGSAVGVSNFNTVLGIVGVGLVLILLIVLLVILKSRKH